jgi:hypothetical protein
VDGGHPHWYDALVLVRGALLAVRCNGDRIMIDCYRDTWSRVRSGVQAHPHTSGLRDQLNLEPKQPDSNSGWTQYRGLAIGVTGCGKGMS